MCELFLDVDVVIKLAAYELLADIAHSGCEPGCTGKMGVTATTQYVARSRLKSRAADVEVASARLDEFLTSASVLEPTQDELKLAATLEEEATRLGVALDTGESQLFGMAILRVAPAILTGDKRAIAAAESLLDAVPLIAKLALRVACLEQALTVAVDRLGALAVRARVVKEKEMDKAVSISFQFTNPAVPATFEPTGLASYTESVRSSAPTLLMPGASLCIPSVA